MEVIDNRQIELEGEYEEVQQKEQEIVQKLNEKYDSKPVASTEWSIYTTTSRRRVSRLI